MAGRRARGAGPSLSAGEGASRRTRITPEGYARLQAELRELWSQKRPRATRAVQEAAAHGDRSENAEYQYGKRALREIDRKLRQLSRRLEAAQVVDSRGRESDQADFGAWVTVEDEAGERRRYRLVGSDENDPSEGWISIESPMGRALLGRSVGEEVVVRRPAGEIALTVLAVEY